jgi:hypothetical protein
VRVIFQVMINPATSRIAAAGKSQEIWPPLRPADQGAVSGGDGHDGHDPPQTGNDQGDAGQCQLEQTAAELGRPSDQIGECEHGDNDEGLQHLGQEAERPEREAVGQRGNDVPVAVRLSEGGG